MNSEQLETHADVILDQLLDVCDEHGPYIGARVMGLQVLGVGMMYMFKNGVSVEMVNRCISMAMNAAMEGFEEVIEDEDY